MRLDRPDCMYNDSDEDCCKCVKHGIIFGCSDDCKDYRSMFGKEEDKTDDE